jgi:isoamylase
MVVDSMRFWVREMHVDGFRFDLASIFTRRTDGSIDLDDPPIISEINADPDFADVRLIAEAWDLHSYQLGRRFPAVDLVPVERPLPRRGARVRPGDEGMVPPLMRASTAATTLPRRPARRLPRLPEHQPGDLARRLLLYDLVAYNQKHNLANGDENPTAPTTTELELRVGG